VGRLIVPVGDLESEDSWIGLHSPNCGLLYVTSTRTLLHLQNLETYRSIKVWRGARGLDLDYSTVLVGDLKSTGTSASGLVFLVRTGKTLSSLLRASYISRRNIKFSRPGTGGTDVGVRVKKKRGLMTE
jgi:hypothetical protein